jgi:hypothetical protein
MFAYALTIFTEAFRYNDAVWMAEKVCAAAEESGDSSLLEKTQQSIALYRAPQSAVNR